MKRLTDASGSFETAQTPEGQEEGGVTQKGGPRSARTPQHFEAASPCFVAVPVTVAEVVFTR